MGATDSEDEADSAEDLARIEAAAAAISQRLEQPTPAEMPRENSQEIQVIHTRRHTARKWHILHDSNSHQVM